LLAVAFSVFKLIGGFEKTYDKVIPYLLEILSEGTGEIVAEHLYEFIQRAQAKAVGWAGIAGLLITAFATYRTVATSFDRLWGSTVRVSFVRRIGRLALLFTLGPILLGASLAVTTAVAAHVKHLPYSGQIIAWLLSLTLFTLVYALVPMVSIPLRAIVKGALLPATLLELAKFGYAIYAKKMVSYSAFYGSFAAVPLFLLWIYIAWYITLLGAVWVRTLHLWNDRKKGIA
jgi:membrane protein